MPYDPISEINAVIIGVSGSGKSALINQIYDEILVKSTDQPLGCTVQSARVSGHVKDYPDLRLNLYDTAGLSDSGDGSVPTAKAFIQLIKLCYTIPNGIHLLIFCHPKGRIASEQFKTNYRIFYEELCEMKIPSLLVITNCDYDSPLNEWWDDNKDVIRDKLKFVFVDGVCVSTLKHKKKDSSKILDAYKISRQNLIEAIRKYASDKPVKIDSWKRKVLIFMRTVYNSFVEWLAWRFMPKMSLRPEFEQMFIDLKYSPEDAKLETEQLLKELENPDLIGSYDLVKANSPRD